MWIHAKWYDRFNLQSTDVEAAIAQALHEADLDASSDEASDSEGESEVTKAEQVKDASRTEQLRQEQEDRKSSRLYSSHL